jgi:hypothetical protein
MVKNAALQRNWLIGSDVYVTRNRLCTGLCTETGDGGCAARPVSQFGILTILCWAPAQ